MKPLLYVTFAAIGLLALIPSGPRSQPQDAVEARNTETNETVNAWLEGQRKGQKGYEFWHPKGHEPFALYAVSSYEIVDAPCMAKRVVRIHAATRGGQPTVRLYTITVFNGKIFEIAQQGD